MILTNHNGNALKALKQGTKIQIDNSLLETLNEFKYLGVIIDERLRYESHIKMIKQSIFARLATLKKIRPLIEQREALLLYKSYIIPYFDLGNLWFNTATDQVILGLQTLQNKSIKNIYGKNNHLSPDEAHKELRLFKVCDRIKIVLIKQAHRMARMPGNLVKHRGRLLRSNRTKMLTVQRANNSKYEKSFLTKCTRYWNSLPKWTETSTPNGG